MKGSTYSGNVSMSFSYTQSPGGLKGSYSGKINIKYPPGGMGKYSPGVKLALGYQPSGLDPLGNLGQLYANPAQFKYFENSDKGGSKGGLERLSSGLYNSLNRKEDDMGSCQTCGAPVRRPMNVCPRCYADRFNQKVY